MSLDVESAVAALLGQLALLGRLTALHRVQIPDYMTHAALFAASCDRVGVGVAASRIGVG